MYVKHRQNIDLALDYHERTKHSYLSVRTNRHYLDWENKPFEFKVYSNLPSLELPRDLTVAPLAAIHAVREVQATTDKEHPLTLTTLTAILFFSAGLTKKKVYPGNQEHWFRAAPSTGALYEVEVYVVCGDILGLEAGVYHFCPGDFKLRQLRKGDYRSELYRASGGDPATAEAPATLALTSIFWRNTWKYQARAYRHFFWDSGTMTSNLLAVSNGTRQSARLLIGFVDGRINQLLGLDEQREASLCLIPLESANNMPADLSSPLEVAPINPDVVPLSEEEVDYPLVHQIQSACSLLTEEEVSSWRNSTPPARSKSRGGKLFPLEPIEESSLPTESIDDVILRRGSTRRFAHKTISFPQLSTILQSATRGIVADFLGFKPEASLIDCYVIANAVDNIPAGAYFFAHEENALELIKEGSFRQAAGFLCLEQELGADASAVVFFMADLNQILKQYGNRGYRAVQFESGILGGKMYLCAYALGLGATGITFYDDDVTAFFSPHAEGKSCIFVTCLGKAGKLNVLSVG